MESRQGLASTTVQSPPELDGVIGTAQPWMVRPGSVLLPDGRLVADLEVVVRDDVIESVRPRGHDVTAMAYVIDAPDATLMPGLIDSHVHLTFSADECVVANLLHESLALQVIRAAGNAQRALAAGVTTAVDCGGITEAVVALREAVAVGTVQGPRLLVSGAPLTTTAGHCYWLGGTADSQDELIRAMRSQVAAGVDLIKVMVTGGNITEGSNPRRLQFPPEAIVALARECERLGRPLMTHAHTAEAVALSASVGARIIAHATCVHDDGSVQLDPRTLERLLTAGCYVDPTLTVAGPDYGDGCDRSEKRRAQRGAMLPLFRAMHEAGASLLAGTDSGVPGVPHGSIGGSVVALHREVGHTVGQALLAATAVAAKAFGIDDQVGTIAPGLSADLLLLDGLVESDIEAVKRPLAVWKSGVLVVRNGSLIFS